MLPEGVSGADGPRELSVAQFDARKNLIVGAVQRAYVVGHHAATLGLDLEWKTAIGLGVLYRLAAEFTAAAEGVASCALREGIATEEQLDEVRALMIEYAGQAGEWVQELARYAEARRRG